MRQRVLYITIRDWGVGDELALQGAIFLMNKIWPGHLNFFGNKNPELRVEPNQSFKSDVWSREQCDFAPDLVVYAGGTAWGGKGHESWEGLWPTVYLGVGGGPGRGDETRTRAAIAKSLLFIARDAVSAKKATEFGAERIMTICCPSLFLSGKAALPTKHVGIVYQGQNQVKPHSCGSETLHEAEVEMINGLSAKAETLIICHWIGDYAQALWRFPKWHDRIVYSRLLSDYIDWYGDCGKIITMRFHGAYLGAALGRPTVCVKQAVKKSGALPLIGVPVLHPSDVDLGSVGCFSNPGHVESLKARYLDQYLIQLQAALGNVRA